MQNIRAEYSDKEQGVAEGVALPDISGLGYNAQSLIMKLRRDVEEKRIQATPQAVLAAASELAGDMDFAPQLLVKQVLGQGVAEGGEYNKFKVGQRATYKNSQGQEFPVIVTAVDFDDDAVEIRSADNKPFPNSGGDLKIVVDPGWKFLTPTPRVDPNSIIAVSPSMRKTTEASYEGNIGIMELFKFFSKAEKEDPKLVARVKEMIKQRRDREVWRIIQDYTGTQLTGKEFELLITAPAEKTIVNDNKKVLQELGVDKFIELAQFSIEDLKQWLNPQQFTLVTTTVKGNRTFRSKRKLKELKPSTKTAVTLIA
jgi:hypothetical protein